MGFTVHATILDIASLKGGTAQIWLQALSVKGHIMGTLVSGLKKALGTNE